ncbi:hypothetical protein BBO99_00005741 [Phytophthora kernoviae]|uniref:Uncharacterized protein n=2 Tax=Phytophthora kernoviae TaxID=325452 RepID=A0A3R7K0A7_9STRA|nr:hypothetical protein G195_006773 [Phytophthora kernoviae 00238/432]KAG2525085.1 hypothetical protein JM18_004782 [Phytophthora kernoviae]KAG2527853.1 hypothetical protein JM16_002990 [Phytophthora kernoviae]RLN43984.1 hypothetical protein BBI17_003367 [Phytophthora kernoviae]RLN78757.1 hypothetical protein BBO99_00005741 [Phytophthora kernoviae]
MQRLTLAARRTGPKVPLLVCSAAVGMLGMKLSIAAVSHYRQDFSRDNVLMAFPVCGAMLNMHRGVRAMGKGAVGLAALGYGADYVFGIYHRMQYEAALRKEEEREMVHKYRGSERLMNEPFVYKGTGQISTAQSHSAMVFDKPRKVFNHANHARHRWKNFMDHDSKNYMGLSTMAGGVQLAKAMGGRKRSKGIAYVIKKTAEKLPRLMVYPLVLGVTGVELFVWGASYFGDDETDENISRVTRNAKLAPAAFAFYGVTLNQVYPYDGRWRRVRGFLRPVKWGAVGLAIDYVITNGLTARSEAQKLVEPEKE